MKTILRLLLCCLCTVSLVLPLAAASADEGEKSALTLRANALQKESVRESLQYLTSHIQLAKNDAEKRSILFYTATLQETLGQFMAAAATYAQAAAINADNAQGMPAASNAELYLYAARSSLEACDFQSADSYLDASPVNSSTDKTLIARKRLLSAWSALCKAGDYREAKGVVANLEEFAGDGQLADIRCEVLFTLWYVTEDEQWRSLLKKDYPHRPETAIAEGSGSVMAVVLSGNFKGDMLVIKRDIEPAVAADSQPMRGIGHPELLFLHTREPIQHVNEIGLSRVAESTYNGIVDDQEVV